MSQSKRENQEIEADTKVWYEDGNIVLIAGSTAFKLYKGLLASVSPVLKDMFSLARPDNDLGIPGTETFDGCPTVRTTDSPRDLRCFLYTITTSFVELLDRNTLVPFARLAATVRIAHKYQAEQVLHAAGSRLRAFFTPDVIAELHAQTATHVPQDNVWESFWDRKQRECGVLVPMTGATGVEAVSIARLLGYDDMLPLALLLCCACAEPLELRNGVRRADGAVVRLSDGDYLGCVQAAPALARTLHMLGAAVMHKCAQATPPGGTVTHSVCKKVLVVMGNEYQKEPVSGPLLDGFVWFQWRRSLPKAYAEYAQAVCDKCFLRMVQTFRETFSDMTLYVEKESSYIQIVVGGGAK
ncbi:hypothetical protein GSI_09552 [Ganoderma sinense ZZ0214-1]|uniref:BTB domain-containing protein n=1 Tax=Ganoderma sinense ZZ0214-1 TaxID=1077348 RepID=A0A2G8S3R4_9APHY|nr:hypothetical protein GSI_09552 [Ganoderma sinense ZZ0214-1]